MINEINQQKTSSKIDQYTKDVKVKSSAASAQNSKPAASSNVSGARSAVSLAAAAGLPADKLSSSIVSFAKFFSLPLKPQLLADIRRQALNNTSALKSAVQMSANVLPAGSNVRSFNVPLPAENSVLQNAANSAVSRKTRETLSLCAAAAESKGAELSPKGLESYAEAVDPDSRRKEGGQRDREQKEKSEKKSEKIESINAEAIKKIAFEYEGNSPLLEILNKLPGKNNQRWIVLPFDFLQDEKTFYVSMRILLEGEREESRAVLMAMDILIGVRGQGLGDSEGERLLFIFEFAGEKIARLIVCFGKSISNKTKSDEKALKSELSKKFDIHQEKIFIKNCDESFPYEMEFDDGLPVIDEAV